MNGTTITMLDTVKSTFVIIQSSSGVCNETLCPIELTQFPYNSTVSNDSDGDEVERLELVTQYLWRIVSPVLILVGVVGNCVNLAVVWKMRFWRRTPLLLLAILALTDITVLLDGLLRYWINYTFDVDVRTISDASCKINLFVIYLGMQFSSWILVCMTIDRFIKTNFPFTYMRVITVRKAYVVVLVLFVFLSGVNLHFFWTNGIINSTECDDITTSYENFEEYVFVYIDFSILSAVPFIIMIILNVFIFRALNKQLAFRKRSVVASRKDKQKESRRLFSRKLTRMLLFVSFYFLVSTVPISVYFMYDSYVKFDDDLHNGRKDVAWSVLYLFQYSNYSLNFVWYAAHNKVFRDKMKEVFGFKPKW